MFTKTSFVVAFPRLVRQVGKRLACVNNHNTVRTVMITLTRQMGGRCTGLRMYVRYRSASPGIAAFVRVAVWIVFLS